MIRIKDLEKEKGIRIISGPYEVEVKNTKTTTYKDMSLGAEHVYIEINAKDALGNNIKEVLSIEEYDLNYSKEQLEHMAKVLKAYGKEIAKLDIMKIRETLIENINEKELDEEESDRLILTIIHEDEKTGIKHISNLDALYQLSIRKANEEGMLTFKMVAKNVLDIIVGHLALNGMINKDEYEEDLKPDSIYIIEGSDVLDMNKNTPSIDIISDKIPGSVIKVLIKPRKYLDGTVDEGEPTIEIIEETEVDNMMRELLTIKAIYSSCIDQDGLVNKFKLCPSSLKPKTKAKTKPMPKPKTETKAETKVKPKTKTTTKSATKSIAKPTKDTTKPKTKTTAKSATKSEKEIKQKATTESKTKLKAQSKAKPTKSTKESKSTKTKEEAK